MTRTVALPPPLASYLQDVATSSRRASVLRAAGTAFSVFATWTLLCCGADRLLHLSSDVRMVLLGAGVAGALIPILRLLLELGREIDWISVAAEVERREPRFEQRLLTVVSRLQGDASQRGSEEILSHLVRDVQLLIEQTGRRTAGIARRAVVPWIVLGTLMAVGLGLARVPDLGARQLLARFAAPLADIAPVTTTRIELLPGDVDIVQSEPLQIDAKVERLDGDSVVLCLNTSGDWYREVMTPLGGDRYRYTLNGVDRDVQYYAIAGDAVTRPFVARALRRPSIEKFAISYVFPAYTRLPPLTVSNTDGLIEAPSGTEITLSAFATEPLQSALLTAGSEKILMSRTADLSVRRAVFQVQRDLPCSLDLISARDVAGTGPAGMSIRAIPEHPPVARLMEAGLDLSLTPREIARLNYQAADDYAVTELGLKVQVDSKAESQIPIQLLGEPRLQRGAVDLDLGRLELSIGDVVTARLVARDSAGHVSTSQPLQILVSACSIDLDARERLSDMQSASSLSGELLTHLQNVQAAIIQGAGEQDPSSGARASSASRANLALTNASEAAALLRHALCRAILHCHDPRLCDVLAAWIDRAQQAGSASEELFRERGNSALKLVPATLGPLLTNARELQERIRLAATAQQANAVMGERFDLLARQKATADGRAKASEFRRSVARTQLTVADEERAMGLDPAAADIEAQLKARMEAGDAALQKEQAPNFSEGLAAWSEAMAQHTGQHTGLEARLSAAAEAEALRPDANLLRARDLRLASRVAGAMEAGLEAKHALEPRDEARIRMFAVAVQTLEQQYETIRRAARENRLDAVKSAEATMKTAGDALVACARDCDAEVGGVSAGRANARHDAEDLALQASAAAAAHDYAKASALDEALMRRLAQAPVVPGATPRDLSGRVIRGQEDVSDSMNAAQKIDDIGQNQQAVVRQTRKDADAAPDRLVLRQREVVTAIDSVTLGHSNGGERNSREAEADALVSVQQELASLPARLSNLQQAVVADARALTRAHQAREAAGAVPHGASDDQGGVASRAAAQATADANEAAEALDRAMASISPQVGEQLLQQLAPFAPETNAVRGLIESRLKLALLDLQAAARSADEGGVERGASSVRSVLESVQRELASAQDAMTERDPLAAAKSFAAAAVTSLASTPPDVNGALSHEVRATGALARAWDQSIHDAATKRLAIVPAMQPLFTPWSSASGDSVIAAGTPARNRVPMADDSSMNLLTLHESDPIGYEEPLRIYFSALGKAQAAGVKGAR